ncbi:SDR family oxidoreductase [Rubellimicrobium roseum]|uniref:SDR family oxidoreductase n=1 Tax=Rubellimicrobium roseum TaxID=687525 RepID=A0A5C4NE76_9RHOB|nr:SDR family oxidoreductase [Rubellimicrobium roseum]TNC71658.1 SDR family oxidoreductase [Rubellimicrobium roseum]
MLDLSDQIAIVTGSDSGIGQAIAIEFARAGADVAVTFHTDAAGAEETARCVRAEGRRALVKQLDVMDEAAVDTLFGAVESELGVPGILVNNAGTGGDANVVDMDTATWDRVVRTDLYGPFFCCRAFIRARRRAGAPGGKIVNITSVHEAIPTPGGAAYGAAKGGLLTFTRSLALELAPQRINVNAVAPGLIRTPMTAERTEDPEAMKEELPRIPWNRPGEPWEVARLALYLASPDADYVTGQSFTIDGGLEMNWGQGA